MHQGPTSLKKQLELSARLLEFGKELNSKLENKRVEMLKNTLID